jgi:hypothetical protein
MRVLLCKEGKINPNYQHLWDLLVAQEAEKLQSIETQMRQEDPDIYKDVPITQDWLREAHISLINASYRLGCGEVWSS